MKKTIALLLAAVILLSFAACAKTGAPDANSPSPSPASSAPAGSTSEPSTFAEPAWKGKTLTIACNQLPESLIIQTIKPTTGTLFVMPALYSRLYGYNENDELVPDLATGYEWVDERSIRVFLREDAYASGGDQITAEDVKFSFTAGIGGVNANSYADIEDVIVEDKFTARIVLKSPVPTFVDNFRGETFSIVSKAGIEKDGGIEAASKAPFSCTTGPYKFYEWKEGQYIILQYNENYYDKSYVPSYEFIKYIAIADNASRCLAVQSGDADIAGSISLADTLGYKNSDKIKYATYPQGLSTVLFFNCTEGIFTNPDLRKALGYLIDWEECAKVVAGDGAKLNEASFPRSSPYFYDIPYQREYNPQKGLEIMAQAGYPNGFSFEIVTAGPMAHHTNVALLIQAQLAQYGINVTVTPLELAAYFGVVDAGEYEAHMCNSTDNFIVHMAFYDDRYTRAQNFGGPQLSDPYVTDLVRKARAEFDFDKRKEYTDALQQYMVDNRIGYGICDDVAYVLYDASKIHDPSSDVAGIRPQYIRPVN